MRVDVVFVPFGNYARNYTGLRYGDAVRGIEQTDVDFGRAALLAGILLYGHLDCRIPLVSAYGRIAPPAVLRHLVLPCNVGCRNSNGFTFRLVGPKTEHPLGHGYAVSDVGNVVYWRIFTATAQNGGRKNRQTEQAESLNDSHLFISILRNLRGGRFLRYCGYAAQGAPHRCRGCTVRAAFRYTLEWSAVPCRCHSGP